MDKPIEFNVDPQKQIAILSRKLADAQEEAAQWQAVAESMAIKLGDLIKQQSKNDKPKESAK